ncbi:MAG: energy-coupling factor transporter ATPase [Coriobacteriia bacterium]|nr:energy-coupling factor transporter ATPase [Coriobacteriia bacterium]
MPVVFEHVTYDYPCAGDACTRALWDVSFEVADGEFLGIIGHTGSGKSTLVQHINGLLQPTSGRVAVNGVDLADKRTRREVRRQIGMAFQYPESQLFAETVAEDIAFGPRNLSLPEDEVQNRVRLAMAGVELDYEHYAHRSPFDLSGGQMRRVALAGIIAMDPKVLVLDEPMAGLDPSGRDEIMAIVRRFHAHGMTIIMVSHSMEDIAAHSERVLVLKDGRVFAHGTPSEVFSRGLQLREIGLDVPFATSFATRLRDKGFVLPDGIFALDELADSIASALGGGV